MEILVSYGHAREDMEPIPVADLAAFVLKAEGLPESTEASISFVDDGEMARLNAEYRGKEGPTDVLSFECDRIDDAVSAAPQPADGIYELGDVIIAPDVARVQAASYGQSLSQEIELLAVHGLLHLCGYDHMEEGEAQVMEAREDELLRAWREGGER